LDLFKGLTGSLENEGNNLQEKDLNKSLKNVMVSMNELWAEALLIEEKDGNFDKLSCNGNERLKEICGAIKKETGSNPVIKKPEKNAAVFCIYADISYLANGQEGYVCASNKYTPGIPDTNPAISACNNTNYTCPLPLGEPVLPPSLNEEVLGHLANISIYEGNLKYERDDYNIEMLSCSISPEISKECNQVFTKTGSYPVIKTEKGEGVIGDFCIYVKLPEKENGVDQYGCEMRWSGIITAINPANGYCTETTYDCPMR